MIEVRRLPAAEVREYRAALADVLLDCVQGGASVSFMASFSKAEAESFFEKVREKVESNNCILLAAFTDSKLVGTIQVLPATPPISLIAPISPSCSLSGQPGAKG